MNRLGRRGTTGLIVLSCITATLFQTVQPGSTMPSSKPKTSGSIASAQTIDFSQHFRDLEVEGSILIYDATSDRTYQHNPQRNATPFLPASTFKILNALISLETKVITDDIAVLTWDGISRQVPEWNRDLNMREAMKLSAIWFYQVLARRIGHERMQKWVTQVGYGNQTIGSKAAIDNFWLEGELRITAQQQIQFLQRLYKNDLPFSERSLAIVKDMLVIEKTPDYTIRAKTGWTGFGNKTMRQAGWIVGYLEKGENVYFFATNIDLRTESDAPKRLQVTRHCLKALGLL